MGTLRPLRRLHLQSSHPDRFGAHRSPGQPAPQGRHPGNSRSHSRIWSMSRMGSASEVELLRVHVKERLLAEALPANGARLRSVQVQAALTDLRASNWPPDLQQSSGH